ncbi:MAG: 8-amino-7-oxononanoate synthase [Planctomycetales bacterium]|nr:8-amino-7-oxononanoate synthase [Planctomycetales bacterium]
MSHDPLAWISEELADYECRDLRRRLAVRGGAQRGDGIQWQGAKLANFGSNDYLGLATHPDICQAVRQAVEQGGWGSGASPLITGRGELHARLEGRLAEFEACEAALLFPSGFAANVGAITCLAGPGDVIFSDQKNHASIIDGCRLSGAAVRVFPHGDVDALRTMLCDAGGFRRRLIVTDSLFSMDGDFAPLADFAELADEYSAMLLVDEAHATGVFGERGRGACELVGVESGVHVRVGTLSKALGSIGGFVSGSRPLIEWLVNRARPYFFSTAPPEAIAAAGLAALNLVSNEVQRRERLLERSARLRAELTERGFRIGNSQSQIVPIIVGEAARTMEAAARLREQGFFVPGIRPPSVPSGESLLRISLTYHHDDETVDRLLAAIEVAVR